MIDQMRWSDRRFTFDLPRRWFPAVLERLRGTPARCEAIFRHVPEEELRLRVGGEWSAKEHVGHLDDIHDLDSRRLDDFLAGSRCLTPWDATNAATEEARHNDRLTIELLERLRRRRQALVRRLEGLTEERVEARSFHERLGRDLRLIDWAFFVAEHDDHHLARARGLLLRIRGHGRPADR